MNTVDSKPRTLPLAHPGLLLLLYGMYFVIFGTAAFSKFSAGGVPPWFLAQFEKSALNAFPGALTLEFYSIAILEAAVCLGLLGSLLRREPLPGRERTLLRASLVVACVIFVILSVGLRLTGDFNTASQVYLYFCGTFVFLNVL